MKVSFLGGATGIGASSAYLQIADKAFLIDCGIRFDPSRPLPNLDEIAEKEIDAILVTHAHTDHTGGLPVAHASFPLSPIWMTPPTRDLIEILLRDALKINEQEQDIPIYQEAHVEAMLQKTRTVSFDSPVAFGDVRVTWLPASHIIGAAMLYFESPEGNVLFTGDYSLGPQLTVPSLRRPTGSVDLMVTETTYGNRLHVDRDAAERKLIDRLTAVAERKGRTLIPAFAIGRAQEVLLILKKAMREKRMPEVPVFVDGMVRDVCNVYSRHENYVSRMLRHEIRNSGNPFFSGYAHRVSSTRDRDKVLNTSPAIIIASSGMLAGGASAFYARHLLERPEDAIFITGYQDEESPGKALLRLATKTTDRYLRLGSETYNVKCEFDTYTLSAHADKLQMAGFISSLSPKTLVMVHGDEEAKAGLANVVGVTDVVFADNGTTIERKFEKRSIRIRSNPPSLTEQFARKVIDSLGVRTIDERRLAHGLTGERLSGENLTRLVALLADWNLVERDDIRPHILHVKNIAKVRTFKTEPERLKKENWKGRLLETFSKAELQPPIFAVTKQGKQYVAQVSAIVLDAKYSSDNFWSDDAKTAEHLAANNLLDLLAHKLGPYVEATAPTNKDNPKGTFLTRHADKVIAIELFPHKMGIAARGTLGDEYSPWFAAKDRKVAEQAVYSHFLVKQSPKSELKIVGATANPKSLLHELKQQCLIDDFDFIISVSGPSHEPVFSGKGWCKVKNRTFEVDNICARTKKEFERLASEALVNIYKRSIVHEYTGKASGFCGELTP